MTNQNHPFHLVDKSPWPIIGATSIMIMMIGLINWFHMYNKELMLMGMLIIILTMIQWWRDIIRESTFQGLHTKLVIKGLRWGMILFIISEVFFFISFFWAFFHSSLSPTLEIGSTWPPMGILPFNPLQIPLLNTTILLSSGVTVTWAHHSLLENNYSQAFQSLLLTIILGMYFTMLQAYEYMESPFTISDSIYGTVFFVATGFHGLHVLIGTTFLLTCLIRHSFYHFSSLHHFGFEGAAWYWHFVDIVWLFLYISIYWWGS
uniref:cytochrome c oxidase subunit III n=1 Tax=Pseudoglomeris montshadskii TaxID=3036343 RepID=UPI00279AF79F|nr:cytochrome c oxidase subunit III [Pseudoglomeris montshadskii]WGO57527.1 cytochrome c oxidase subunit III [Pseudoglomeris montshadskii]